MRADMHFPLSEAVRGAYRKGQEDETLEPLVAASEAQIPIGRIRPDDAVIFYNIRGEREIELTRALTEDDFSEFPVDPKLNLAFATMIEYDRRLKTAVAFPPETQLADTLGDVIAAAGLRQVRITEAEKAVHVGFFLNGKKADPLPGEERIIVPTRKDVALFDEAPEMSIDQIAQTAVEKIRDPQCSVIIVNFPNVDVVGHIENEQAVIRAVEAVDRHLGQVLSEARTINLPALVTADHGTVEKWLYPDGAVDTGHTTSRVPFILIHPDKDLKLASAGELTDIAPTMLSLLGLAVPQVMTGRCLIDKPVGHPDAKKRLLLIILDGWGHNDNAEGNLIARARTPVMDELLKRHPWTTLDASGTAVGLPDGTVGNSEAGHLHIGAGRRIYSDRLKIDQAIAEGGFFSNPAFTGVMNTAKKRGKALHLMGIVSFFSSHGSIEHLFALMEMARRQGIKDLYIHGMLGRRGELPESGARYIRQVEEKCQSLGLGRVVSVIGRYWSMDREENWDRIEKTYRMLISGDGEKVPAESTHEHNS